MGRFFAFGCSLTYYLYPTWADLLAKGFGEYYNQGFYGRGNQYIMHSVYETDSLLTFNKSDTVMVMLTSFTRNDTYINGEWKFRGSVYNPHNADVYTEDWHSKFWSPEHGMLTTWLAAKSIRTLLEARGCKFEIMLGLPMHINGLEFCNKTFTEEDSPFVREIYQQLTVKESLQEFVEKNYKRNQFYEFKEEGFIDVHPTVEMHGAYCRKNLLKYWKPENDLTARRMHGLVDRSGHRANWLNSEFRAMRGKKLGTTNLVNGDERFK